MNTNTRWLSLGNLRKPELCFLELQVVRTDRTTYSAQFDLMKDVRVRVYTLLSGPCTNYRTMKSTNYTELVQMPPNTGKPEMFIVQTLVKLRNLLFIGFIHLSKSRCCGNRSSGFCLCVPWHELLGVQLGKKSKDVSKIRAKSVFLVCHLSHFLTSVKVLCFLISFKNCAGVFDYWKIKPLCSPDVDAVNTHSYSFM